jgi:alpha-1,2-mannosyltransferase
MRSPGTEERLVRESGEQVAGQGPGRESPLHAVLIRGWLIFVLTASVLLLHLTIIPNTVPTRGTRIAHGQPVGRDFLLFYASGSLVRAGRPAAAYDDAALFATESAIVGMPIAGLRWPYPPGLLLVTGALARLPYLAAYLAWIIVGVGSLAYVAWRLARSAAAPILLPLCPALSFCVMTGQFGILAAALAGAGFLALFRRPALAGVFFGILTLKLQLAVLLPFGLLAAREYRALAAMATTAVLLQLVGVGLFGTETAQAFLTQGSAALDVVARAPGLLERIPTVYSTGIGAGLGQAGALLLQAATALLAIVAVWTIWRRTPDPALRSLAWAAGLPLAVPYLFDYDLAIFVVPLAALARRHRLAHVDWASAAVMTTLWSAAPLMRPLAAAAGFQVGAIGAAALLLFALQRSGAREARPRLG